MTEKLQQQILGLQGHVGVQVYYNDKLVLF